MNPYFSADVAAPFQTFSVSHLAALAVIAGLNILMVIWCARNRKARSVDRFRVFLAVFLLINEILSVVWCAAAGVFTLDYALPIQLCDLSAFLSVFLLLRGNRAVFEPVYFWGLGGSLQALVTPDLYYPFPHFVFFNFFLVHGLIVSAVLFMIAVKRYRPVFGSVWRTFIYTNAYAAVIAVVNWLTGGNYMFLSRKPQDATIIDFLGPWPWYLLSLEGVLIVTCLILYLPFAVMDWRRKRAKS